MSLTYHFDTTIFRAKAVGTRHLMALGTRRAVQLAGNAGAVHARSEHPHKVRTGRLTSPAELRVLDGADVRGREQVIEAARRSRAGAGRKQVAVGISPDLAQAQGCRQADDAGSWGYLINYTPYGAYVEYGTKPHKIFPKAAHGMIGPTREGQTRRATGKGPHEHIVGRGLALRFMVGGRIVFARYVNHPGTQALPFLRPAAEYAALVLVRETETHTFASIAKLWD